MEVPHHFQKPVKDDSVGEYEVCCEGDCLIWIELRISMEHPHTDYVNAAHAAFVRLGWTGERNKMRCPKHSNRKS